MQDTPDNQVSKRRSVRGNRVFTILRMRFARTCPHFDGTPWYLHGPVPASDAKSVLN